MNSTRRLFIHWIVLKNSCQFIVLDQQDFTTDRENEIAEQKEKELKEAFGTIEYEIIRVVTQQIQTQIKV